MPKYYNKLRSPLPLQLPSGSRIAPPKSYVDISISDEGCSSVVRYVKKGFLVPPRIRPSQETQPEVKAKTSKPAPKKEAPKKEEPPKAVQVEEEIEELEEIKEQEDDEVSPDSEMSLSLDPPTESAQLSSDSEDMEAEESPKPKKKSRKRKTRR